MNEDHNETYQAAVRKSHLRYAKKAAAVLYAPHDATTRNIQRMSASGQLDTILEAAPDHDVSLIADLVEDRLKLAHDTQNAISLGDIYGKVAGESSKSRYGIIEGTQYSPGNEGYLSLPDLLEKHEPEFSVTHLVGKGIRKVTKAAFIAGNPIAYPAVKSVMKAFFPEDKHQGHQGSGALGAMIIFGGGTIIGSYAVTTAAATATLGPVGLLYPAVGVGSAALHWVGAGAERRLSKNQTSYETLQKFAASDGSIVETLDRVIQEAQNE